MSHFNFQNHSFLICTMCRLDHLTSEIKLQLHKSLIGFYFLENSICIKYSLLYTTKMEGLLINGQMSKVFSTQPKIAFPHEVRDEKLV